MNKCFICDNRGTVRNSSGWHDKEKNSELIEMTMTYPSQGNTVHMKIFKCRECIKFSEELSKMEDISDVEVPPVIEEILEPEKELPDKKAKENNLERE